MNNVKNGFLKWNRDLLLRPAPFSNSLLGFVEAIYITLQVERRLQDNQGRLAVHSRVRFEPKKEVTPIQRLGRKTESVHLIETAGPER